MKTLFTLTALISLNTFAGCPGVLLKKKVSHRTAYTTDFKKVSGKEHDMMKSLGCNPEIKVMSGQDQAKLLDAEYAKKRAKLGL